MSEVEEVEVRSSHAFNFPLYSSLVNSGGIVSGIVVYLKLSISNWTISGNWSRCKCKGWWLGASRVSVSLLGRGDGWEIVLTGVSSWVVW